MSLDALNVANIDIKSVGGGVGGRSYNNGTILSLLRKNCFSRPCID